MAFARSRIRREATGVFYKRHKNKTERGPQLYGWLHNQPYAKQNTFAWWQEENRDIRKTIVSHCARQVTCRDFYKIIMGKLPGYEDTPIPTQRVINELCSPGPYTLLCPSNKALSRISQSSWDTMARAALQHGDTSLLESFIRRHVVVGIINVKQMTNSMNIAGYCGGSKEEMARSGFIDAHGNPLPRYRHNYSDINSDSYGFQATLPSWDFEGIGAKNHGRMGKIGGPRIALAGSGYHPNTRDHNAESSDDSKVAQSFNNSGMGAFASTTTSSESASSSSNELLLGSGGEGNTSSMDSAFLLPHELKSPRAQQLKDRQDKKKRLENKKTLELGSPEWKQAQIEGENSDLSDAKKKQLAEIEAILDENGELSRTRNDESEEDREKRLAKEGEGQLQCISGFENKIRSDKLKKKATNPMTADSLPSVDPQHPADGNFLNNIPRTQKQHERAMRDARQKQWKDEQREKKRVTLETDANMSALAPVGALATVTSGMKAGELSLAKAKSSKDRLRALESMQTPDGAPFVVNKAMQNYNSVLVSGNMPAYNKENPLKQYEDTIPAASNNKEGWAYSYLGRTDLGGEEEGRYNIVDDLGGDYSKEEIEERIEQRRSEEVIDDPVEQRAFLKRLYNKYNWFFNVGASKSGYYRNTAVGDQEIKLINLEGDPMPIEVIGSLEQQFAIQEEIQSACLIDTSREVPRWGEGGKYMAGPNQRKVCVFPNKAPIVKTSRCWNGYVHLVEGVCSSKIDRGDYEEK